MGISKALKEKFSGFSEDDRSRLVRMGWEDRTTFDVIEAQFGLSPNEFVQFMRSALAKDVFNRWRRRVYQQGHLKNEKTRGFKVTRFKCSRQSIDGVTKGWK
ncbi:TIGR03643 family protein [Bdellovibrio sp. KM01]|uniref:TIGR03643 family protein n=1 Tax=Bdellovibrio sp. KM01 TaxID=2748865 RepID=UPI0015E9527D|nr:TIGR03643 family protein [Bdellovibrio sp. KM01]QLY24697.1 TIGR03643 family protein [Bdellovibrio sp. KM01]